MKEDGNMTGVAVSVTGTGSASAARRSLKFLENTENIQPKPVGERKLDASQIQHADASRPTDTATAATGSDSRRLFQTVP